MSIIACPACQKKVSQAAASCPHCGHPIAGEVPANTKTVQLTLKKYKLCKLVGGAAVVLGILMAVDDPTSDVAVWGSIVTVVGLVVYASGRFGAWWNNR